MNWGLFGKRRFLPLFLTQFLGAFNDNCFKNGLIILIIFVLFPTKDHPTGNLMTYLAMGLFVVPFLLFSAVAGQLADKFDRARLARWIKFAEVLLMLLAALAFHFRSLPLLLALVFLMSAQSTFFGPIKYALLPQQLQPGELMAGNAFVSGATYLAILTGSIAGNLLGDGGAIGAVLAAVALAGFLASLAIPPAPAPAPKLRFNFNLVSESAILIRSLRDNRKAWRCVMAISSFWAVGALYVSLLPNFCKSVLGREEDAVTVFFVIFSLGIGAGSLLSNRLTRGKVRLTYAPWGALTMTLATCCLAVLSLDGLSFHADGKFAVAALLAALTAVGGGVLIVPLYAKLQKVSARSAVARTIAANNIFNAVFMTAASLAAIGVAAAAGWFADRGISAILTTSSVIFLLVAGFEVLAFLWVLRVGRR